MPNLHSLQDQDINHHTRRRNRPDCRLRGDYIKLQIIWNHTRFYIQLNNKERNQEEICQRIKNKTITTLTLTFCSRVRGRRKESQIINRLRMCMRSRSKRVRSWQSFSRDLAPELDNSQSLPLMTLLTKKTSAQRTI